MTRTRAVVVAAALVAGFAFTPGGSASEPGRGCLLAFASAAPIGASSCPGVRPGALVEIPKSAAGDVFCTMGFVYRDSKYWYITTAGHCVLGPHDSTNSGNEGTKVWPLGKGPVAMDAAGRTIGRYAFASQIESKTLDIGLIRLTTKPNPQVCHFGGPRGTSTTTSDEPGPVGIYGNALGFGDVVPARTLLASSFVKKNEIYAVGPSISGDSGAPVLTEDGRALGYMVAYGIAFEGATLSAGNVVIDRIGPQIAAAAKALRVTLRLQTARTL